MELTEVLSKAVSGFAPSDANQELALNAAVTAAERFMTGLGLGTANTNRDELRNAALEAWNSYCEQALDAEYEVTHVTRRDLTQIGATEAQARLLSDDDMRTIARRMGDDYVIDGDFWTSLGIVANRSFEEKHHLQIDFSDSPHE